MNYKSIFKFIFICIAIALMGYYFYQNWSTVKDYQWQFDLTLAILSVFLLWLSITSYIYVIRYIFKKLIGVRINFFQIYRIINISNIGRYLPGKFMYILGYYMYLEEYGINKKQATISIIACEISSKGGALVLGLCYFLFSTRFENYLPYMLVLLLICLILLHPRILNYILNYLLIIFKKQPIKIDISYSNMLVFLLMYIGVWLLHSLAFYVLVNSITPLNSIGFIRFSTILPLCWVVGYIVLLAPGGLGVREGMLTLTLSEFLSPEIALTIAIIQRVWFILVEGFNFLTSLLIKPERHKSIT